jgi:hypothetical protein
LKENFRRFNFSKNYKEKEMSFRRLLTAMTVFVLFAGLAAAQLPSSTPLTCDTVAQVTPTLRAEGLTELVGDIVITCRGGSPWAPTAQNPYIPTANITVNLTNKVTSRLLDATTKLSEALLLVDEPGSSLTPLVPGAGPAAPITLCKTPQNPLQGANAGSCQQLTTTYTPSTGPFTGVPIQTPVNADTAATAVYNAWQGTVTGTNQVLFQGIPVLPPATTNISRVYRITNIRIAGGGALAVNGVTSVTQVLAYLSNSGSTSLPVSSAAVTVGFVQSSLSGAAKSIGNSFQQCDTTKGAVGGIANAASVLSFSELFPSAFKTRLAPIGTFAGATYLYTTSGPQQNTPGQSIQYSESGFILPVDSRIGLADTGTRLQAKFANLPKGVDVYVTNVNLANVDLSKGDSAIGAWRETAVPALGSPQLTSTFAQLTPKGDLNGFGAAGASSLAKVINVADVLNIDGSVKTPGYSINGVKLSVTYDSNNLGTATATWEVLNSNPGQNERFDFGVFIAYTPAAGTPTLPIVETNATATLNYGSTSSIDTPAASYDSTKGTGAYIPRFMVGGSPVTVFNIVRCQTVLLFPYVTTDASYNTGLAISNTSKDPIGTPTSNTDVKCTLTPYGSWYNNGVANSVAAITPFDVNVAPGQTTAFLASDKFGAVPTGATGFTGLCLLSATSSLLTASRSSRTSLRVRRTSARPWATSL